MPPAEDAPSTTPSWKRRSWMLLAVAALLAVADGAVYARRHLPLASRCRTLSVSESTPPAEPGVAAEWILSGGIVGHADRLQVHDDGRVVGMRYERVEVSTTLQDETTRRLIALAGSLAPDVEPRVDTCPHPDAMWQGYVIRGHGTREATAAEQAEIRRLLVEVQRRAWPTFGR